MAIKRLRQMEGALISAKGKAAISEFWKNSTTIASTSIHYEKSKYQLRGQMAKEVVDEGKSRSRKRQRVQATQLFESNGVEGEEDEGKIQDIPNNSGEKDDEKDVDDIWKTWKTWLKTIRESTVLPALSPESHNVIWCGKKVLRRPVLPVELFQELNKQVPNIKMQRVDSIFKELLLEALDTSNKEEWLDKAKMFRNCSIAVDLIAKRDLIACIFNMFSTLFDGASGTLSSSESCLRYYVIDPLLQACNKYIKDLGHNVTFYPGEIELKAMTVQLKDQGITDKRLRYNADGTILYNSIATEVLLSEVSSAFAENNKGKTSFDHYKAMFGLLMVLRTLATTSDPKSHSYCRNNSYIDESAMTTMMDKYPVNLVAKIKNKTEKGKSWFELSIFWGRFEMLLTGGICGSKLSNDVVPFLGSNVPLKELVDGDSFTSENMYVNCHDDGVKAHFQVRSLRNWTELSSSFEWACISSRFHRKGFATVNPLNIRNSTPLVTLILVILNHISHQKKIRERTVQSDFEAVQSFTNVKGLAKQQSNQEFCHNQKKTGCKRGKQRFDNSSRIHV
ncbi:hypothetical protein G6F62_005472 [Rhizopus arrhizus]|uniref:Uncharacterized protein n=1 Tax=Rhizopus oryzae TaxID=64495 RepID=A0A9P7BUV7_RHIOR|nr:hypothetical protein G6F24_001251 [Rhizopus arrhizus]KAG1296490.1 hypothetical protein G6F66_003416 [Rhizopus arrhizus]KAG1311349.1 hypothetical protein G6F64_003866 [Rhizopus arrhizus]KAG1340293.1 hypothetical protein G6F62_005472 [Rhizopus arrhizus]